MTTLDLIDRDDFIRGYAECAIWLASNEHGEDYWNVPGAADGLIDPDDHLPEGWQSDPGFADCADFLDADAEPLIAEAIELEGYSAERAGHDFYLTRNGHGAGFWDRGLKYGDALSDMARLWGDHLLILDGTAD